MDYSRIYAEFIADRLAKQPVFLRGLRYSSVRTKLRRIYGDKGGLETHHIVPSWRGGTDASDNVVTLTFRDHVFAHLLLAKAYGGKEYAALWGVAGITGGRGNRTLANVLRTSAIMRRTRAEMRNSQVGDKSVVANQTVYTWIEYSTGNEFVGTRHDLVNMLGHGETAKWETGAYFLRRTVLTRSGWFTTDRFSSVKAANDHKIAMIKATAAVSKKKNSGSNNPASRAVICLETGIVYSSYGEASVATGANRFKIGEVCAGNRNKAGGFRWAYATS